VQDLGGCSPATASFLAAAAHLAFTTAAASAGGASKAGVGSVGFHTAVGDSVLPQEVQQALHWQQHGAAVDAASSTVRFISQLLTVLSQSS